MRIESSSYIDKKISDIKLFSTFKEGDIIQGKIVNSDGEKLSLQLLNGEKLSVTLSDFLDINDGDVVELQIYNINNNKILARPNQITNPVNSNFVSDKINMYIKAFNISYEKQNIDIIKMMLKNGLPLDKITFNKILNIINTSSNLISCDKDAIISLLTCMKNINHIPIEKLDIDNLEKNSISHGEGDNIPQKSSTDYDSSKINEKDNSQNTIKENSISKEISLIIKDLDIQENKKISSLIHKIEESITTLKDFDIKTAILLMKKGIEVSISNIKNIKDNLFNSKDIELRFDELFDALESRYNDNNTKLLINSLRNKVNNAFIKPEQLNHDKLNESINEITKGFIELEDSVYKTDIADKEIKNTITEILDQLHFTKTIQQYNYYYNIPVVLNNQKQNAQLFLFNDKKDNKRINPKDTTLLIALDLDNTGRIESLITIDDRIINTIFRVENDEIMKLINISIPILKQRLISIGYSISNISVNKLSEPFNFIKMDEEQMQKKQKSNHLDVKI